MKRLEPIFYPRTLLYPYPIKAPNYDEDELIATFPDITDVRDGLKIDGKDFEDVINHSYIVALN